MRNLKAASIVSTLWSIADWQSGFRETSRKLHQPSGWRERERRKEREAEGVPWEGYGRSFPTLWLMEQGRCETKKGVDAWEMLFKLVVEEDGRAEKMDGGEGLNIPEEAGDALKSCSGDHQS